MSKCPFGFGAEDADDEEEMVLDEPHLLEADDAPAASAAKKSSKQAEPSGKSKKKDKIKVPEKFDMQADPVSWFYQNQIKSEAEFQAKKDTLRTEAKKRLDQIMDKKNQRLMWPSDSEFDDMSISSGELSELDSDVHSLASVRTCAYSWIAKKQYKMPAEAATRWAATFALALSFVVMYFGVTAIVTIRPVYGVVKNNNWPGYVFLCALAMAGAAGCLMLAASWRSRKLLLTAHLTTLIVYGLSVVLLMAITMMPPEVDTRMQHAMCGRWSETSRPAVPSGSPMCDKLPALQQTVAKGTEALKNMMLAQSLASLLLCGVSVWYCFELCYVEKKGAKHMRRHRRNKFTIPWDKIKVVGKPLPCGGGMAPAAGHGAGGGKCPVGFSSSKDKAV